MFPTNFKQMKKIMKQLGIEMEDMDVEEVIIRTANEELIFKNPEVTKVVGRGVELFQVVGDYEIVKRKPKINEEDVKLIMEQAGVSEEEARKALEEAGGDLVEALMKLQKS